MTSLTRAMLSAGIPSHDPRAFVREGRKMRLFDSGGGGSTTSTVTQSNLPDYAEPYFTRLMDRGEAVSNSPYQAYNGQRVAGLNGSQNQAAAQVGGLGNPAQYDTATGMATAAGQGSLGLGGYQAGPIGSTYNPNAVSNQNVQSNYHPGQFDGDAAAQYMSPYQQNVTDIALQNAQNQFRQQGVARDAQAASTGAFGGSRAALVQQQAAKDNQANQANIQAQGSQQAFENAQSQFERDRAAQAQAGQMDLAAQTTNAGSSLNAQQFNEAQRQNAAGLSLQGQTANEAARAQAANIGLQGYQQANASAAALGQLGQQQQQSALDRAGALMTIGDKQQQSQQQQLDAAYNDFVNQRDYQQNQLNFYSGILHGVPVSPNSDTVTTAPSPSALGQLAGLGIAGAGAYGAYTNAASK